MKSFYLLIAHGSKRQESNAGLFDLIKKFQAAYPGKRVEGCFLDIAKPDIAQGIETCVRKGAEEIVILPLMLFEGRHVREDIPRILEAAHSLHPNIVFHYASPLSDHPLLLQLIEDKARSLKRSA